MLWIVGMMQRDEWDCRLYTAMKYAIICAERKNGAYNSLIY